MSKLHTLRTPLIILEILCIIIVTQCKVKTPEKSYPSPFKLLENIGLNECNSPCWQEIEANEPISNSMLKAILDAEISTVEVREEAGSFHEYRWYDRIHKVYVEITTEGEDNTVHLMSVWMFPNSQERQKITLQDIIGTIGEPERYYSTSHYSNFGSSGINHIFLFEKANIIITEFEPIDGIKVESTSDESFEFPRVYKWTLIPEEVAIRDIYFYGPETDPRFINNELFLDRLSLKLWGSASEILVERTLSY